MNYDPRLASIANPDGSIDVGALEALSDKDPGTMTIPELRVVDALLDDPSVVPRGVQIAIDLEAFTKAIGGTVTREKVRHGKTVERTVRRYRGREDVRRLRAQSQPSGTAGRVRNRSRERRSTTRRASSPVTSGEDPPPAPARLRVRRPSGSTAVFWASSCIRRGGRVDVVGEWADLPGVRVKSFRNRDVLDLTWLVVA